MKHVDLVEDEDEGEDEGDGEDEGESESEGGGEDEVEDEDKGGVNGHSSEEQVTNWFSGKFSPDWLHGFFLITYR